MMARYQSVDALQNLLATTVFRETQSAKKAAGRALGTLVELITFYMIRDWNLESGLAIERILPEYGNPEIHHNVEFTLHPASNTRRVPVLDHDKSLTTRQLRLACQEAGLDLGATSAANNALLRAGTLRHAATFGKESDAFWTAHMVGGAHDFLVTRLQNVPYAMFECKRVGIEDGMKKGPQTIEKAKQGAYVARTVSGLQRVPRKDGSVAAVVETPTGDIKSHPDYYTFLRSAIDHGDLEALSNIVLTVGVVSNHGNWFTAETQNKEMRVLAQSYDWLLFLTDNGLAEFIEDVLQGSQQNLAATREAFTNSFGLGRKERGTSFTKVTIDADADRELTDFFAREQPWDRWFNVIAPAPSDHARARDADLGNEGIQPGDVAEVVSLSELRRDLHRLREIHEQEDI